MKRVNVLSMKDCAACRQCEVSCSTAFYKAYDPDLSCIRISAKPDGSPKISYCLQCGKCARTCEHEAITQNAQGVYMINRKKCVGCGKCAEACPMKVIVLKEGTGYASKCIACGICVKGCPMGILEIKEA